MKKLKVQLKEQSYPVYVGYDLLDKVGSELNKMIGKNRLFIIYDSNLYALYGKHINRALRRFKPVELVIKSGEKSKSDKELSNIHAYLLSEKISRSDLILAVGGGMVSDLTGFAAATILRGVRWGIVSTSLLSMVDASIGGKTGINHHHGKNLIGAFWQPSFVFCDLTFLATLPDRELLSGMGEILKYCGLAGTEFMELLLPKGGKRSHFTKNQLLQLISLSVAYKAEIVGRDERESGCRMLLNFGHTIGHALEQSIGYDRIKHGEAVILGLWGAVYLSQLTRKKNQAAYTGYRQLLEQCIASIPYYKVKKDSVLRALAYDKKRVNRDQKFILLDRPGKPIITKSPPEPAVRKAIGAVLGRYKELGVK